MATRLDSSIRHGYPPSPCLPAFTLSSTWMRNWRGLSATEPSHRALFLQGNQVTSATRPSPGSCHLPSLSTPARSPGCVSLSSHHLKDPKSLLFPPNPTLPPRGIRTGLVVEQQGAEAAEQLGDPVALQVVAAPPLARRHLAVARGGLAPAAR